MSTGRCGYDIGLDTLAEIMSCIELQPHHNSTNTADRKKLRQSYNILMSIWREFSPLSHIADGSNVLSDVVGGQKRHSIHSTPGHHCSTMSKEAGGYVAALVVVNEVRSGDLVRSRYYQRRLTLSLMYTCWVAPRHTSTSISIAELHT